MKGNEYECERCHGIFKKGWSDEEARTEADQDPYGFQTPPPEAPGEAVICDDCFQEMRAWVEHHGSIERALTCNCLLGLECDKAAA